MRVLDKVLLKPAFCPSMLELSQENSLTGAQATVRVSQSRLGWKRALAFLGPGFLIAVGYMDPGNWATDLTGGAAYGYTLLSVVLVSSLAAMLLQSLAVKLGVAAECDLARACRDQYSRPTVVVLWLFAEIGIVAMDLAELIGSAIALQLLFHLPMTVGVLLTSADVLLLLLLQNRGFRYLEALVIVLVGTIAICMGWEVCLSHPAWIPLVHSTFVPAAAIAKDPAMLYIAIGILGATVMPHNLYLHSAIVQTRAYPRTEEGKREAVRFGSVDSASALTLAFFINAAILVMAAAVFHANGQWQVSGIRDAYKLLTPMLGSAGASSMFAVALLASGQNASVTGTLAGQIVMEGFLQIRLPIWLRRIMTRSLAMLPTLAIVSLYGARGAEKLLLLTQVILSMQLSFAVFPLVAFTSNPRIMGSFVNLSWLKNFSYALAVAIAALNVWLLAKTF